MKIERTTLAIPTHPWQEGDIEPPFIKELTPRKQPIYPYSTQEIVETRRIVREYEAVVFENEYLKVTFLPELNGRIYSAFDKVNGREMFYSNPAIKPCLFGLRGAWAAVGVEYNFPNSHSTTTLQRVPYRIVEHPDGSASFICGNLEHVSQMGWSVEVKLRANEAAIEMISRLQNPTEFPRRFYYWVNAAVPIFPESRYIYPPSTHRLYTHPPMDISSLAYLDYPIHKGLDISVYKNVNRHWPAFAETMEEDFFGLYHHEYDYGLVHVADHSLVRGRKLWLMGNAHDGRIWLERLMDQGPDYCELQTGPFSLQSDYRMLRPGQSHVQNDTWYPVGAIGGFNAASPKIAANAEVAPDGEFTLRFSSTVHLNKAELVIRNQSREVVRRNLGAVRPLEPQEISVVLPQEAAKSEFCVEIIGDDGRELLEYTRHLPRVNEQHDAPKSINSPLNDNYQKACYWEQQGHFDKALQLYIADAGGHLASTVAVGRLKAQQGLFEEALNVLAQALAVEACNAEAHFYSGVCCRRLGRYEQAQSHLSRAIDDLFWASNAMLQLAMVSISQNRHAQALQRIEHLVKNNSAPTARMVAFWAMALRKSGDVDRCADVLRQAGRQFAFDPLVVGEQFLSHPAPSAPSLQDCCNDDQRVLDIVGIYLDVRQFADAEALLLFHLGSKDAGPVDPLVHYHLAFVQDRLGKPDKSERSYKTASKARGFWQGASRLETEPVLLAAIGRDACDSTALHQLGNLLASRGRWTEAIEHWANVEGQYRSLSLRAQGLYWWKVMSDRQKAARLYDAACELPSCGAKTIWEFDHLLEELGQHEKRLSLLARHENTVAGDNRLQLRKASALIAMHKSEQGLSVLEKHDYALCEGAVLPRILFEEACAQLGRKHLDAGDAMAALEFYRKPLQYPTNQGVGKPAANMEAQWWCRCGAIWKSLGNEPQALQCFAAGANDGTGIEIDWFPLRNVVAQHGHDTVDVRIWVNEIFKAVCRNMLGEQDQSKTRLDRVEKYIARVSAEDRREVGAIRYIRDLLDRAGSNDPLGACLSAPAYDGNH